MTTPIPEQFDLIAGGALPLNFWVTEDSDGTKLPNAGATAEAVVIWGAGFQDGIEILPDGTDEWKVVFGAGYSLNHAGRRVRVRVWITPAASVETTPIDVFINVRM